MAAKYPVDNQHGCETFLSQSDTQHLSGCVLGQTVTPECEIEMEGYSLAELYEECPKNPKHPNFIQVSKFNKDHLPPDIRNQDNIMESIQRRIDQTVRVRVAYTSLDRPNFFSDNSSEYPYRNYKGKRLVRYGTGSINRLLTPDLIEGKSCPCQTCTTSGNPSKIHCILTVCTSTHVIFDDSEAEKASFDCFFDSDQIEPIYKLYGLRVDKAFTTPHLMYHSDLCEVICVTHDANTIQKLSSTIFSGTLPGGVPRFVTPADPPAEVIVSHPHGCCKQITIGHTHFLTVPIKPVFEVSTPIPLPQGTKCRFYPEKPGLVSNKSAEYQINNIDSHHSINEKDFIKIKDILSESSDGNESKTKCKEMPLKPVEGNSMNNFDFVKTMSKLERIVKTFSLGTIQDGFFEHIFGTEGDNKDMPPAQEIFDTVINVLESLEIKENSSDAKDGGISTCRKLVLTFGKLVDVLDKWVQVITHPKGKECLTQQELEQLDLDLEECYTEFRQYGFFHFIEEMITHFMTGMTRMLPTRTDYDSLSEEEQVQKAWNDYYTEMIQDCFGGNQDIFQYILKNPRDDRLRGINPYILEKNSDMQNLSISDVQNTKLIRKSVVENSTNEPFMRNHTIEKKSDCMEPNENLMSDPESLATVDRSFECTRNGQSSSDREPIQLDVIQERLQAFSERYREVGTVGESMQNVDVTSLIPTTWLSCDKKPEAGVNMALPRGLTFTLPPDADYAMRYYKPGRFQFPLGTKFTKSDGMKVPIPDGTEFENLYVLPRHFYVSYDNDTCPGSSGATVYNNFLHVPGITHFTHSGSVGRKNNRSGVQENIVLPHLSGFSSFFESSDLKDIITNVVAELVRKGSHEKSAQ